MTGNWKIVVNLLYTAATLFLMVSTSCKPYRIEYHTRPGFYQKAVKEPLPDEVVLEDGTIIRYVSPNEQTSLGLNASGKNDKGKAQGKVFQPREETEDLAGNKQVILRAFLPEHVLYNTLTCLRNEEYHLLWEQGLSKKTQEHYAENEVGEEEFTAFMTKHRHELVATLTRMLAGMSGQEVAIEPLDEGVTRCRLRRQIADPFKFTSVDMVKEDGWLKLLLIE